MYFDQTRSANVHVYAHFRLRHRRSLWREREKHDIELWKRRQKILKSSKNEQEFIVNILAVKNLILVSVERTIISTNATTQKSAHSVKERAQGVINIWYVSGWHSGKWQSTNLSLFDVARQQQCTKLAVALQQIKESFLELLMSVSRNWSPTTTECKAAFVALNYNDSIYISPRTAYRCIERYKTSTVIVQESSAFKLLEARQFELHFVYDYKFSKSPLRPPATLYNSGAIRSDDWMSQSLLRVNCSTL